MALAHGAECWLVSDALSGRHRGSACNPSTGDSSNGDQWGLRKGPSQRVTRRVEAGGAEAQGHSQLRVKFKISLADTSLFLKMSEEVGRLGVVSISHGPLPVSILCHPPGPVGTSVPDPLC